MISFTIVCVSLSVQFVIYSLLLWIINRQYKTALAHKDTELAICESRCDSWRDKYYAYKDSLVKQAVRHSDQLDELELTISYLKNEVERRHEQADSWNDCAADWADYYMDDVLMLSSDYNRVHDELTALQKTTAGRKKGTRTRSARVHPEKA